MLTVSRAASPQMTDDRQRFVGLCIDMGARTIVVAKTIDWDTIHKTSSGLHGMG